MKRKEYAPSDNNNAKNAANRQIMESNLGVMASHVFGFESLETIFSQDTLTQQMTQKSILQNTDLWVHNILQSIEPPLRLAEEDNRPGRLGIPQVRFDSTVQVGTFIMSQDRLHIKAQSSFSTIRANACCYSGRWQYELQLESKGVMQVGWSMGLGEFSAEAGVGDTVYSFAYDGNRVRKWNLVTSDYGDAWQIGDVIGCTLDLDQGSIHFFRNGRDLGKAFSSIPLGPNCVYYAAVSLAYDERVQANFGSVPFKYPIQSFSPLQQAPIGAVLRTNQLLHWLYRIASVSKSLPGPQTKSKSSDPSCRSLSSEAVSMLFSELLMRHLANLLSKPYVVEACLVPFFHDITSVTIDKKSLPATKSLVKLDFCCDSFVLLLESDDFKELINTICKCLIHRFNQTSASLEYAKQRSSLAILSDIIQNMSVRKVLLKQSAFVKIRIPEFMDLKQIDQVELKQCVPEPWWPSDELQTGKIKNEFELRKQNYIGNCQLINNRIREFQDVQERVLMLFLNNNDETVLDASSRKYFLYMFRLFLKDNHTNSSLFLNTIVEQTPLPIALSYFHRLVGVLRLLWEEECPTEPVCVPLATFYNGSVDYFTMDRLGGVLSHLINTFRGPLTSELGQMHRVLTEQSQEAPVLPVSERLEINLQSVDALGIMTTFNRLIRIGQSTANAEPVVHDLVPPGHLANHPSLTELLDGVILLYYVAAHKQLCKVCTLRDDMDKYIAALNEAKTRLSQAKETCPEAAVQIQMSIKAFERKIEEQAQVSIAWMRGAVFTVENRANVVWVLRAVLLTLEQASQQGPLFAFVPDFYLDALVEMCTALRNYFNPTVPLEEMADYKTILIQVAEFLVRHFTDSRIVNLGSKDTIIEALAGFIAKKQTMECLESISVESQERFVKLLLKPYDNRPWAQSNWMLMRVWQGYGFAFRYQKSPHLIRRMGPRTPSSESGLLIHQTFGPCPSPKYQELIARTLRQDSEMAAEFLNSLLKQLNWSFSEFISMMQEIQNLSKRPERVIIDARQLKMCAACFDFVISLLRVLEMLCFTCLPIFTDLSIDNTENLLERLCQLLSQILLRITSPSGCFMHVVLLEVPDLDAIDQFPVLAAVTGVLLALLDNDLSDKESSTMSIAARSLLLEPAFQINSLKYVLGESEDVKEKDEHFSFKNYPSVVSESELESVSRLVSVLSRYQTQLSVTKEVDEEELCPICCAMPLAVTFRPCNHQSCKSCITHHLMDCKECFFCKTAILSVVATDGKLLFDSNTSSHKISDIA